MAKKKIKNYETSMTQLEELLNKVEEEEVGVDELSQIVKDSVALIKDCKNQLRGIESEVEKSLNDLSKD